MPIYAIPYDLDKFLNRRVHQASHFSEIKALLDTYIEEGAHPENKTFDGRTVYTLDCNVHDGSKHRFIFERVKYNNQDCFLLRDLAWQHDYDKALRWQLNSPNPERYCIKTQASKAEVHSENEPKESDATSAKVAKLVYFKRSWFLPYSSQSAHITEYKSPGLLIGPPGAGKTLVSIGIFQSEALKHQAEGVGKKRFIYLCDNRHLVKQLQEDWFSWSKTALSEDKPVVEVEFKSFDELAREDVKRQNEQRASSKQLTLIPENKLKEIIQNKINWIGGEHSEFCADDIYAELLLQSHYLVKEAKTSFQDSKYKNRGEDQSIYKSEQERQKVFQIMKSVINYLDNYNHYFPGISLTTEFEAKQKYDLVIVDEGQSVEPKQLLDAIQMSKDSAQYLLLGDSYQKRSQAISSLSLMEAVVNEFNGGQKLNQRKLKTDIKQKWYEELEGVIKKILDEEVISVIELKDFIEVTNFLSDKLRSLNESINELSQCVEGQSKAKDIASGKSILNAEVKFLANLNFFQGEAYPGHSVWSLLNQLKNHRHKHTTKELCENYSKMELLRRTRLPKKYALRFNSVINIDESSELTKLKAEFVKINLNTIRAYPSVKIACFFELLKRYSRADFKSRSSYKFFGNYLDKRAKEFKARLKSLIKDLNELFPNDFEMDQYEDGLVGELSLEDIKNEDDLRQYLYRPTRAVHQFIKICSEKLDSLEVYNPQTDSIRKLVSSFLSNADLSLLSSLTINGITPDISERQMKKYISAGGYGEVYHSEHFSKLETDQQDRVVKVFTQRDLKNDEKNLIKVGKDEACGIPKSPHTPSIESLNYCHHNHIMEMHMLHSGIKSMDFITKFPKEDISKFSPENMTSRFIITRELLRQLKLALDYFKENGITHLDLKPDNIIVDEYGNIRVIDFGGVTGTKGYLHPDFHGNTFIRNLEGAELKSAIDARDKFALMVIVWEFCRHRYMVFDDDLKDYFELDPRRAKDIRQIESKIIELLPEVYKKDGNVNSSSLISYLLSKDDEADKIDNHDFFQWKLSNSMMYCKHITMDLLKDIEDKFSGLDEKNGKKNKLLNEIAKVWADVLAAHLTKIPTSGLDAFLNTAMDIIHFKQILKLKGINSNVDVALYKSTMVKALVKNLSLYATYNDMLFEKVENIIKSSFKDGFDRNEHNRELIKLIELQLKKAIERNNNPLWAKLHNSFKNDINAYQNYLLNKFEKRKVKNWQGLRTKFEKNREEVSFQELRRRELKKQFGSILIQKTRRWDDITGWQTAEKTSELVAKTKGKAMVPLDGYQTRQDVYKADDFDVKVAGNTLGLSTWPNKRISLEEWKGKKIVDYRLIFHHEVLKRIASVIEINVRGNIPLEAFVKENCLNLGRPSVQGSLYFRWFEVNCKVIHNKHRHFRYAAEYPDLGPLSYRLYHFMDMESMCLGMLKQMLLGLKLAKEKDLILLDFEPNNIMLSTTMYGGSDDSFSPDNSFFYWGGDVFCKLSQFDHIKIEQGARNELRKKIDEYKKDENATELSVSKIKDLRQTLPPREKKMVDIAIRQFEMAKLMMPLEYQAPELITGAITEQRPLPDQAQNIYAAGIIFLQMLTGGPNIKPDIKPDKLGVQHYIEHYIRPYINLIKCDKIKSLLLKLTDPCPITRITAEEALKDECFSFYLANEDSKPLAPSPI